MTANSQRTAISLFTGAFGLDLGFDRQGFDIRVVVENDPWAIKTIKANESRVNSRPKVIEADIHEVSSELILEKAGLRAGELTLLIGAPPCEPHSTAGRRNGGGDSRTDTLYDFIRVINEARPLVFCMEEVKGFLTSTKKHMGFYDRAAINPKMVIRFICINYLPLLVAVL